MLSLAERVFGTIQRYRLLPSGARVVIALSGGADSTALACLLVELAGRCGVRIVAAAHLNHRLRGRAADEDQAFCEALAERLGLPCRSETADVQGTATREGLSIEAAGRACRYSFLFRVAETLGATHVAAGHTRDDQSETVLLHMLRGAGPRGLGAMAADRPLAGPNGAAAGSIRLVRPLLDVTHEDLVGWLRARSTAFREDESNADRRYMRNRIRHDVIPFLEERVSPSISRVLARNAAIAASDAACLDALASAAFTRLATVEGSRVELDRRGLAEEAEAVARRVVLLALRTLSGTRGVGFDHGERLLALAAGATAGPLVLPGATAMVAGGAMVLAGRAGRGPVGKVLSPEMNFWRCVLSIPGESVVPGPGRRVLSSSVRQLAEGERISLDSADDSQAVIDAGLVVSLAIRQRLPGDWLRPLGLGGRKKLQDYFVDRKVPRAERDRVPLVVDDRDRIVWVAGHGIDEEFRVRAGTRDVVILKLRGESA